jgi:hypothetical protein
MDAASERVSAPALLAATWAEWVGLAKYPLLFMVYPLDTWFLAETAEGLDAEGVKVKEAERFKGIL